MKHVAKDNGLEYGKDVRMVSLGESYKFKEYLDQNQNKTLFGVLFCTTDWSTQVDVSQTKLAKYSPYEKVGFEIPCVADKDSGKEMYMYSLMYNFTLIPFDYQNLLD